MKTKYITPLFLLTSIFAFAAEISAAECEKPSEPVSVLLSEDFMSSVKDKLSVGVGVAYESEYVFRGAKCSGASIVPTVDLGYELGGGLGLRAGFFNNTELKNDNFIENDISAGITYSVMSFSFDLGYCAYLYPHSEDTHEFSFGVSYDTSELLGDFAITPFITYYYDVVLYVNTLEAGLSYSAPVTKWIIGSEWGSVDLAATYGHVFSHNVKDYDYVMFSADFSVALTDIASISAGVRYSNKSEGGDRSEDNCWFGTGLSLSF